MSSSWSEALTEGEGRDLDRAARRLGVDPSRVLAAARLLLAAQHLDDVRGQARVSPDIVVGTLLRDIVPLGSAQDLDDAVAGPLRPTFARLLASLAEASDLTPVRDVGGLTGQERRLVVDAWNDTARADDPACLHELVERRAATSPYAMAIEQGSIRLDYATLNARADRVAARLRHSSCGRGDRVAVHMDRSPAAVVALLAVLKAGAAYVPIDSQMPSSRLAHVLNATAARIVLASPGLVDPLLEIAGEVDALGEILVLGEESATATRYLGRTERAGVRIADIVEFVSDDEARLDPTKDRATPDDVAYVIFTSGSTGVPKGVVVRHAPVVNVLRWVNRTMKVNERDRILFATAFAFDLSVYDIFGVLAAGGCVRVASATEMAEPQRLLEILDSERITIWDSAPAALQRLEPFFGVREPGDDLRLVMLSGDWIPLTLPDSIRAAFPKAEVLALGGATEAAIWSNHFRVGAVSDVWKSIPYGRPIANARYYILDSWLRPVPPHVPGELYIGGDCLAEGYIQQPGLTAARFVADPFAPMPGSRMYRTGDRARFWPDGCIEFLGRVDAQVKIRGHRVELGEVDSVLGSLPEVGAVASVVRGEGADRSIVAYVVPRPGGDPIDPQALLDALSSRLPGYMLPSHIVEVPSLPVTANGKLDRGAFPGPDLAPAIYSPPRTATERLVATIWAEVLGRELIGVTDEFFDCGGHSVLLPRVVSKVQQATGVRLSVRMLFDNPVLSDFAAAVDRACAEKGVEASAEVIS